MNHPYCTWCGKKLSFKESTIDHLNSKVVNGHRPAQGKIVLSCTRCNNNRQIYEVKKLPRYKVWIKSRRFPKITRKELTTKERFLVLVLKPYFIIKTFIAGDFHE